MDETASQPAVDALGERYLLDDLLGEGAFARTYRARDTRLARTVAVKLLRSHYAADRAYLDRFQREARSAAKVDHPNVVHVYDYGGHDGSYYLVLQYVPGQDLKRVIDEHAPLPTADAVRITREILSGLAAIHAAGIIHRDIKPQNVLLGWDGVPRVTDFGIAYENEQSRLITLTDHGTTLGTPAYMAPEQARGEPVSERTDLYGVGVVLFELLTGRLPFEAENTLAMMVAHVEQAPPPPSALKPGVPPEIDAVVLRALAKAPGNRFASAQDMDRALGTTLHSRYDAQTTVQITQPPRIRATPTRTAAAAATAALPTRLPPPSLAAPADAGDTGENRHHRRGRLLPMLLIAIVVTALIVALVRAAGDDDGGTDQGGAALTPIATRDPGVFVPITETPTAEPTATTPPIVEREPPADTPVPTNTGAPTETPAPVDTPRPTETPEPATEEPSGGVPTIAPASGGDRSDSVIESAESSSNSEADTFSFSATEWEGGFTRMDAGFLGRPWTAVYGAQSGYGRASLSLALETAPRGEAALTITGVDDEAGGDSPITIEVNGTEIFSGPSPFPSWDGVSAQAPWTAVAFTIPAGVLRSGRNQIVVTNRNPSSTFDSPPYVLLSDVTIET